MEEVSEESDVVVAVTAPASKKRSVEDTPPASKKVIPVLTLKILRTNLKKTK